MAIVTFKQPEPVPTTFTLELDQEEAELLLADLGTGYGPTPYDVYDQLFSALKSASGRTTTQQLERNGELRGGQPA